MEFKIEPMRLLAYLGVLSAGVLICRVWLGKNLQGRLARAKRLASTFGFYGTLVGFMSIGTATGVSLSGYAPQVVIFTYGIPISIALLYLSYYLEQKIIDHE
jgi:hypothetical protein